MTEPLSNLPPPLEGGGILTTLDAVADLSGFLTAVRGAPAPRAIEVRSMIDHRLVPDYADRLRLLEVFAESYGQKVQFAAHTAWVDVPIPRTAHTGPEMTFHLYALNRAGSEASL